MGGKNNQAVRLAAAEAKAELIKMHFPQKRSRSRKLPDKREREPANNKRDELTEKQAGGTERA